MKLYLCEKPSVAKAVAEVLNIALYNKDGAYCDEKKGIIVTWAAGHLLRLYEPSDYKEEWKKWDINQLPMIPEKFKYAINENTKKQFNNVKAWLKKANEVVIATDYDREGEVIGRSMLDYCNYKGSLKRILITTLDKGLIKQIDKEYPGEAHVPSYHAGLARVRADWLVGMNLSRLYTLKANNNENWSVGRVQTSTLNLVVQRDAEIKHFKSTEYFDIAVELKTENNEIIKANVKFNENDLTDNRLLDREVAARIEKSIKDQQQVSVQKINSILKKEYNPLALSMSEAQKLASDKFAYSAADTLDTLQKLYEARLTTYPRTDCGYLSDEMHEEAQDVINALKTLDKNLDISGLDLTIKSKTFNSEKITAHHAIIPTTTANFDLTTLSEKERNLYELVRTYYLSQFMPPHEYEETVIEFTSNNDLLITKGKRIVNLGWQRLFNKESKDTLLPNLNESDCLSVINTAIEVKHTTPPKKFTEGTLIEAMKNASRKIDDVELRKQLNEVEGIGTEATRANIIETLKKRGYIENENKKNLVSTTKGQKLIESVSAEIKSVETTADWERKLKDIEERKLTLTQFMTSLESFTRRVIEEETAKEMSVEVGEQYVCSECGKTLIHRVKKGKGGYDFWGCSGYPVCKKSYKDDNGKPNIGH